MCSEGRDLAMKSNPQPELNLEYYVGYENDEEGIILYTIYLEAVSALADVGVKFKFETKAKAKSTGRMRSTTKLTKLPKVSKASGVVFYDIDEINKEIPKGVRKTVAAACEELDRIDDQKNQLTEIYKAQIEKLDAAEARNKGKIRDNLTSHAPITEKGRFYHRMMLIDTFRVTLKTDFTFRIDSSNLEEIASKVAVKYRRLLNSCVKPDMVRIDPEFYERKVKQCLLPQEQKKYIEEIMDIDEDKLEDEVLPQLPYNMRLMFWSMTEQFNDEGLPRSTVHPKTYTAKNPDCQECGGKFLPKTNTCRDCGFTSFKEAKAKAKDSEDKGKETIERPKAKAKPKRAKAVLRPVKTIEDFLKKKIKSKK